MVTTTTPTAVADRAQRLVAASQRTTIDPFEAIDWDGMSYEDTAFYLPPEFLPLYGTTVWDSMSEVERYEYSRHECAALCSAGIYFENVLMQLILQHLYDMPADDGAHRYLLVETADECRHSAMFGEYVRRAGTPSYLVGSLVRFGGKLLTTAVRGPAAFVAILAAEELLDVNNRATMKDERVHPVSRQMAKIHVLEEARHVSFARAYITEVWPKLSFVRKLSSMIIMPMAVKGVAYALVNPDVYDALGIEDGERIARRNPVQNERIKRDVAKLTDLLTEVGVINAFTRPIWKVLGLI